MYNHTAEGRIIHQNNMAMQDLEIIEATIDKITLIKNTMLVQ